MLELLIVDTESERAVLPDGADGAVQVWREQGEVCAYGYAAEGASWLHLPHVATYRFTEAADPVLAIVPATVSRRLVVDGFERTVLPLALQFFGSEALHASGILVPSGVVALCGDSGVGKSTLAHVLAARGYELWADDAVAFECRQAEVVAIPLPFRPILLPSAVAALGASTIHGRDAFAEQPLACLVVLERAAAGGPPVSIRRYAAAEAFEAAIAHAYCYMPNNLERSRRMMQEYFELVARVPIIGVRFVEDLDQIGVVAERVEALARTLPGTA